MKPKVGEDAPDFTAEVVGGAYQDGAEVSLKHLRGKPVVLVFYPKDNTPGCTIQACAIRDSWDALESIAYVFGVSVDDAKSHRKFIDKKELPYPLLADTDKKIVQDYGVWVEKSMFGKKYMGIERSSFVIGEDGKIMAVLEKVKPGAHLDQLLEVLKKS
ncbi:thioredoxin-dependent thiol peroxidase [Verrucomicrobiaceae bacterium R5-34]|nr:thioredoxin-dependent thiol peroxidase [Verrucomicrobiaceae bacterium R5-34]